MSWREREREREKRERVQIRVAEWLGRVTLVWEVCGSILRNGGFSFDQTLTQGLKVLGEKLA